MIKLSKFKIGPNLKTNLRLHLNRQQHLLVMIVTAFPMQCQNLNLQWKMWYAGIFYLIFIKLNLIWYSQCLNLNEEAGRWYAENFNIWNFQADANFSTMLIQWLRISGVFLFDCREAARLYRSSGEVAQMRQWVGEKVLDVAVKEGGDGSQSVTPPHYQPPHPHPPQPPAPAPETLIRQAPEINKTTLFIHGQYFWFVSFLFYILTPGILEFNVYHFWCKILCKTSI